MYHTIVDRIPEETEITRVKSEKFGSDKTKRRKTGKRKETCNSLDWAEEVKSHFKTKKTKIDGKRCEEHPRIFEDKSYERIS